MRGARMWLVVCGISGLAAGCLSEGRHVNEDTADGDVADTRTDTSADTGVDADTVDLCLGKTCDDQDDCTYDRCVPETGECEHLGLPSAGDPAMPAPIECTGNTSCEDGDPCTTNSCVTWPGGCGNAGGSYCVTEVIPGCGGCQGGCDDGNPCTVDTCTANGCLFDPIGDCLPECVEAGTMKVAEAMRDGRSGVFLKVGGEIGAHPTFQACNDGPNCGCVGPTALQEGDNPPSQLMLRGTYIAPTGESERWSCTTTGCDTVRTSCEPAKFAVRYWVWGTGLGSWELVTAGDAAIPAPEGVAGVAVQGYCLETKRESLIGAYSGVLEIGGFELTFDTTMYVENGTLWARFGSASCPSCPGALKFAGATVPVTIGDGWVEFQVELPSFLGAKVETVRLYSNQNQLAGNYGLAGVIGAVAVPQGGHMALIRRPR